MRPDIGLAEDDEPGLIERGEQLCPGSQFQMFGQVGQQEPAFSSRFQVSGQPVEKSGQHATLRIVDRLFDRGGRPGRHPRRVADHEWRPALGKEIRLHHFHPIGEPQSLKIRAGTGQCARILVGSNNPRDPSPGEDRRHHPPVKFHGL